MIPDALQIVRNDMSERIHFKKSVIYKLQEMQRAYAKIEALSVAYFNTTSLIADEDKVYPHLLKTVDYFYSHDPINRFYKKGKDRVDQWFL